jgi:hypothetical protein
MMMFGLGFVVGFFVGIVLTIYAAIIAFDNGEDWSDRLEKRMKKKKSE